jgi:glutathione S-transferase
MLTLYHAKDSRSFRALWTLEELGVPYELRLVRMPARAQPGYLELNPLGTVPALFDNGRLMTESTAIAHYLVTRYGFSQLAVAPDEPDYATYLNFLVQGEATLTFPQTIYVRYVLLEPDKGLQAAAHDYKTWFLARLRLVNQTLQGREFLCASRFTVADISVCYALKLAEHLGYEGELPDVVRSYWSRMQQRPAYQRAMQLQSEAPQSVQPPAVD